MQSFCGGIRSKIVHFKSAIRLCGFEANDGFAAAANLCRKSFDASIRKFSSSSSFPSSRFGLQTEFLNPPGSQLYKTSRADLFKWRAGMPTIPVRCTSTTVNPISASQDPASPVSDLPQRIKFKRLDKTARHIMQILDKEAVEEVRVQREIPVIKPGYIVQLKVEVPENKRRTSILKGIVIARRNAGLNTTFRLRRLVAGVGVESLFPLYSPSIKEIKVLDKKKVRRAKLYYLRDKMNALRK